MIGAALILALGALAHFAPAALGNNNGNAEVDCGEMLLHGRSSGGFDVAYSMPLGAISAAYLYGHAGVEASRWLWAAAVLALYGLSFALGLMLGGWAAGAAALLLIHPLVAEFYRYPTSTLYAIAVLLVAGLLMRRAGAPTPGNGALLGLAVGLSLLMRSPLLFFPLALAALEALPRRAARAGIKGALPIVAIPCLLLLPWMAMNWLLYGELSIIERGRIDAVVMSSTRLVQLEGEHGISRGFGGTLAAWAGAVFLDPWSYASLCLLRLGGILSAHPVLCLAATGGFLLGRRRAEFRALGLLIAYFLAIHCGISISEAYLVPLWPLLAALGGGAVAMLLGRAPAAGSRAQAYASGAFVVVLAPLAIAGLLALGAAAAYPHRVRSPMIAIGTQREAWLLLESGRLSLRRGGLDAARESFSRAAALRPDDMRVAFYLAWTQALQGHPETLLRLDPEKFRHSLIHDLEIRFLKAAAHLQRGRAARARAEIAAGLAGWEALARREPGSRGRSSFLEDLAEFLQPMSARERERLLRAAVLVAAPDALDDVWLNLAQLADERGDRAQALADMAAMERNDKTGALMTSRDARRAIFLYRKLKINGRASALLDGLIALDPADAELRLERAELATAMGKRSEALELLARAEAMQPAGVELRRRIALAYQELKVYERAFDIFANLAREHPSVAAHFSDRALCEHLRGGDDAALADLHTAIGLEPKFLPAYLTLGAIHIARGRASQARKIYDEALSNTSAGDADPLRETVLAARRRL